MAGDWLKIEADTPDKPEILAMAAALDIDTDCVFGKCFRLWRWFDAHTEKGNARGVTKALLNRMVGVTNFAEEMERVGWLIETANGVELPHFDRHNGNTAKTRALTAKRVSAHKKSNAEGNGASVTSALPREEKSREDILLEEGGSQILGKPLSGKSSPALTRARFQKPTLEEVEAYCDERDNGVPAQAFIDHYESCGWVVGKGSKPMKDWRAAIRSVWEPKHPKPESRVLDPKDFHRYNPVTGVE